MKWPIPLFFVPLLCLCLQQCPMGLRPLGQKRPLICRPDSPANCPFDAICVRMSENDYQCCGEEEPTKLLHRYRCTKDSDCSPKMYCREGKCRHRKERSLCPPKWTPLHDEDFFCNPKSSSPCPREAACIQSGRRFVCCFPPNGSLREIKRQNFVEYHCPARFLAAEIVNNRERRCSGNGEYGQCSPGFVCVASVEDPLVSLCCGPSELHDAEGEFRCPGVGQSPLLDGGRNVFCDYDSLPCPANSICRSASNAAGMLICCRTVPSETPICPSDRTPQSAEVGFVPCDTSRPLCAPGFLCLPSINQPSIALCCSRSSNQILICPDGQTLLTEGGRPRNCLPNQPNLCPSGYNCKESVASSNIYICCTDGYLPQCPSGFSAYIDTNGSPIACSDVDPNICPYETECLEASNRPQKLCCRAADAPRVCPDGQDALLGPGGNIPEWCTVPGAACSHSGFTCQLSPVIGTWVCCGHSTQLARCADGRDTFRQTYTCRLNFLRDCPTSYDCAPSNLNGVNVCCRRLSAPPIVPLPPPINPPLPPSPTVIPSPDWNEPDTNTYRPPTRDLSCPMGWSPFEDIGGAHHFCQSVLDKTCPQGFSCVQSNINGVFLCCRLATNLRCSDGRSRTLLINSSPRLCSTRYRSSCPVGFGCQPSNLNPVHICCSNVFPTTTARPTPPPFSFSNNQYPLVVNGQSPNGQIPYNDLIPVDLLCQDGGIPAYVGNRLIQCNYLGRSDICPPSYICSLSNRQGMNVCCHVVARTMHMYRTKGNVCGEMAIPQMDADQKPTKCPKGICSENFECLKYPVDEEMYCCQKAYCLSNGVKSPKRCEENDDCGENELCEDSANISGIRLCCPKPIAEHRPRCLGRRTLLIAGNTLNCLDNGGCPRDYQCSSLTTNGDSICCESAEMFRFFCPENRDPFRILSSDNLTLCDPAEHHNQCPEGFLCKRSPILAKHICCTPIAFCDRGRIPLIDIRTQHAKRCFESTATTISDHCAGGFSCSESSVPQLRVCCSSQPQTFTHNPMSPIERDQNSLLWTIWEG